MAETLHDDTQKMPRPHITAADLFRAEIDELQAINDMIAKFVQHPSPNGKTRVKAHLARWLNHDNRRD